MPQHSLYLMLFMNLINYCAYFAFVQTKIRMLNVLMQDKIKFSDDNMMLFLMKEIIGDHSVAIK